MKEYNAFENFLTTFGRAADIMELSEDDRRRIAYPERQVEATLRVRMDDGSIKTFEGYRVQHNSALGPYKGGLRYHQNADINEVRALSAWMSIKCAVASIPYGGGKGGITVDPSKLSEGELERLTRAYVDAIYPVIGPETDIPAPDVNTNGKIMGWFCDEYSKLRGAFTPACVTGKPIAIGGSLGREEATGLGVVTAAKSMLANYGVELKGKRVVVQGNGNVGSVSSKYFAQEGCIIVAASDVSGAVFDPAGLDGELLRKMAVERKLLSEYPLGKGASFVAGVDGNKKLLSCDTDILVPAALENQIDATNASEVKAKFVVEAANGPTTADADVILEKMGVVVVPDILANCGGVVVSYFEWSQNLTRYYLGVDEINARLITKMNSAVKNVFDIARKYGCSLRMGAYIAAVSKIDEAMKLLGK